MIMTRMRFLMAVVLVAVVVTVLNFFYPGFVSLWGLRQSQDKKAPPAAAPQQSKLTQTNPPPQKPPPPNPPPKDPPPPPNPPSKDPPPPPNPPPQNPPQNPPPPPPTPAQNSTSKNRTVPHIPAHHGIKSHEPHYVHPDTTIYGVPYWYYNPASQDLNITSDIGRDTPVNITGPDGKRRKVILYWNDFHKQKDFGFGFGNKPFVLAGCKVNSCIMTGDRNRYPPSEVDALIWHFHAKDKSLPKKRYPHTRYVFWLQEPPFRILTNLRNFTGVFNMTFSYRPDSDIFFPLDRMFRRPKPLTEDINYAEGKTKLAAWLVSNCWAKSGRGRLANTLEKYIPIDRFGRCSKMKCDLSNMRDCMTMFEKTYKFYLAFENSLCKGYATYKLFRALRVNIVPVVYGLANYSEIAPPHSYINALDFKSAHDLAQYLIYLDKNDTAYNEYFIWKKYYYHKHPWLTDAIPYCDLCEYLHKDPPPKSYDIENWLRVGSHCMWVHNPWIQKYLNSNESDVLQLYD